MFRKSLIGLHPGRQIHSRGVGSQRSPVGVLAMHRLRMVACMRPSLVRATLAIGFGCGMGSLLYGGGCFGGWGLAVEPLVFKRSGAMRLHSAQAF